MEVSSGVLPSLTHALGTTEESDPLGETLFQETGAWDTTPCDGVGAVEQEHPPVMGSVLTADGRWNRGATVPSAGALCVALRCHVATA